ncbi:hypothetical protein [Polyangium aurulentum]|uniref:hypothetical protein n=1 Tax=Polyangium aurulentum TaxID=2567896 RepID=UPI0010AEC6E7|nr:hypothetical protein [Polyangium aurulentum]UQA56757.1 hypothetical protein E8A73_036465 [Polyangium aurulentum]
MGDLISRQAAAKDILADTRTTFTNAAARGGIWKSLAEQQIGSILALVASLDAQHTATEFAAAGAAAALGAENIKADKLLGKISDDTWNAVGRPAADPYFSLLFPGGFSYYADGDVMGQPDRMMYLVDLLRSGMHPFLPADVANASADAVEAAASSLRARADESSKLAGKLAHLGRMRTALARVAQMELANLKRLYKTQGLSEAEIHTVIPSRPRAASKKKELAARIAAPVQGGESG